MCGCRMIIFLAIVSISAYPICAFIIIICLRYSVMLVCSQQVQGEEGLSSHGPHGAGQSANVHDNMKVNLDIRTMLMLEGVSIPQLADAMGAAHHQLVTGAASFPPGMLLTRSLKHWGALTKELIGHGCNAFHALKLAWKQVRDTLLPPNSAGWQTELTVVQQEAVIQCN